MDELFQDYTPDDFRGICGEANEQKSITPVRILTATTLLETEFEEPKFAVPNLISEGATLLAGRPKLGKSWLALSIAIAIASGGRVLGKISVEQGDVLYLALEDGQRRLQSRLRTLLSDGNVPERLLLSTEWPSLDEGGLDAIEEWLRGRPDARLVVVDTFKKVRPRERRVSRLYDGDYDAIAPLSKLGQKYGVAILIVHHTRKQPSDDAFDTVSGSNGLTGAVDGMMILQRSKSGKGADLHITGRDFEEKTLALQWDAQTCGWICLGDVEEFSISKERKEVLDLLKKSPRMTPKQISEALRRSHGSVRRLLPEMVSAELLMNDGNGHYSVNPIVGNSSNSVTLADDELPLLETIKEVYDF